MRCFNFFISGAICLILLIDLNQMNYGDACRICLLLFKTQVVIIKLMALFGDIWIESLASISLLPVLKGKGRSRNFKRSIYQIDHLSWVLLLCLKQPKFKVDLRLVRSDHICLSVTQTHSVTFKFKSTENKKNHHYETNIIPNLRL